MVKVRGIPQGVNGMHVYVSTRKPDTEMPHVHVSRGSKQRKSDLKYYLDTRDFDEKTIGGFTEYELSKLRAYFARYHDDFYAEWVAIHDMPKKRG